MLYCLVLLVPSIPIHAALAQVMPTSTAWLFALPLGCAACIAAVMGWLWYHRHHFDKVAGVEGQTA